MGLWQQRSTANAGSRTGSPSGIRDRYPGKHTGCARSQSGDPDDPDRFMQAADPIRIGLVDSLNRPGGNVTGINLMLAEVAGKRLELLLELVPAARSIAYLRNPTNPVFARE